ncbi:hypothetical protein N7490_009302 [Penicillium lividum]|nr:hypothetical protein N7490_009302 [Penicillium lividum]
MFCLQFDTYTILGPPGFVWALEWLTIVEEFRGHKLTSSTSHIPAATEGKAKPTKTKAMEILDEEDELFEILEEDIQLLTNKSLLDLKSQWITLLKRKYDEAIKKQKESDGRRQLSKSG